MPSPIVVVAAVIEQDGRFLVTQRSRDAHLGGYWEFPGGKCEAGETLEEALRRELREELDVDVAVDQEIDCIRHAYPERTVRLHFYRCRLQGTPRPRLQQNLQWVTRAELTTLAFPPADTTLIDKLLVS